MKRILIPLLFSLIFIFVLALSPASATTITIGDIFSETEVNATIMINDVIDVAAATINLSYDPSVIVVTGAGNSNFQSFTPNLLFADKGWVQMTAFQVGSGLTGDVRFTELTIEPIGSYGDISELKIDVVTLTDSITPHPNPIDATIINGSFCIGIPGPPIASFTYSPQNPGVNEAIIFNASNSIDPCGLITNYEWDFGDANITDTTEEIITHSYSSAGDYNVALTVTDDDGAKNTTSRTITVPEKLVFDTGSGTYPRIFGTHTGTITPSQTITVSKLYTYPCIGTGGHSEYVRIGNKTWNVTANWTGYTGDGHNITFNTPFIILANKTYNYTIITGSYPQIIHQHEANVTGGRITCTEFVDANGKIYKDWIPAIRLGV